MTDNYKIFLDKIDVISEESFTELMDSLPEFDLKTIDIDKYDLELIDDLARQIIDWILGEKWKYVYVDNIDFDTKSLELADVQSLEDLKEINEYLKDWTIDNYDLLEEILKEEAEEITLNKENFEKERILKSLCENLTLDEVKKLAEIYGKS